ncbi:helix-turn-helix domain-containing protein [Actinomadura nitritigenes]|uniref:helix-turn-helix domain-containing protein n=1 Tax=Actinomadura nitritigenes TaxID=134602 RepID=UPI003D8CD98D
MICRILTADEAADILRIDADDVLGMVAGGELRALAEDGDTVLIAESSLREFMAASWVGEPYPLGGGT